MSRSNDPQVIQAVLVADEEDNLFGPLESMEIKSLLPIMGKPLIDHALKQLELSPVQEVFVLSSDPQERISKHLKENWSESRLDIKYLHCDGACCMGDFVRELDRRAVVKGDFILMTTDSVSNVNLSELLQWHKATKTRDKGSIMTLVYANMLDDQPADSSTSVIVYSSEGKILCYNKKLFKRKKTKLSLSIIKENMQVSVVKGLMSAGIYICSAAMPILYTDNLDYNCLDHLIKGVIDNEDIMGNSVYLYRLSKGFACRVYSPETYDETTRRLMERWIHPLTCFDYSSTTYSLQRSQTLVGEGVVISGHLSSKSSVIGDHCTIGPNCQITQSVIGPDCVIGANVTLKRAYLFDHVTVGDNSTISHCMLGSNVKVESACTLQAGCVIAKGVSVGPDVCLINQLIAPPGKQDPSPVASLGSKSSASLYSPSPNFLLHRSWHAVDFTPPGDLSTDSDSDDATEDLDYADDDNQVKTFFTEVIDNFKRGMLENVTNDNLILEVNSMKHAYNIPFDEVTTIVFQALLQLPSPCSSDEYSSQLFSSVKKFLPLLKNYIRTQESQNISLLAIEEYYLNNCDRFTSTSLVKLLKLLYDEELIEEDTIIDWYADTPSLSQLLYEEIPKSKRVALRKEKLLTQFVDWLKTAEEDSDEESEDESD